MQLFNNHNRLFGLATLLFVSLSLVVAIVPALHNQENNALLPGAKPLEGEALKGKEVFIANGCVACHTQQVRNIDMDNVWGARPSIAADYAGSHRMSWWMNSATLMGTERTGPDLTNIGNRLPSEDWHLVHLFNPRTVVEESIMPSYPWLFEVKEMATKGDRIVNVPVALLQRKTDVVVAKEEALQLVAYLQSLKQQELPSGQAPAPFLYKKEVANETGNSSASTIDDINGAELYSANCQACHQANGEGLKGAFPPLKGSKVVLNDDPELIVNIIMKGYNAREEFADMPAVGKLNKLSPAQITAIINHERGSWGNDAEPISVQQVEKIIAFIPSEEKPNQP
jgi:cytochrome c oxidase cbb3-type subunit II